METLGERDGLNGMDSMNCLCDGHESMEVRACEDLGRCAWITILCESSLSDVLNDGAPWPSVIWSAFRED